MKISKDAKSAIERIVTIVVLVGLALGVLWGAVTLAWRGALKVPPDAARVWALLATAALPLSVWATWGLALRYAKGIVTGIDWGIGKVAQAGSEAANLRVHIHREMKRPPNQYAVLPEVEIIPRRLPSGGNVVEL